MKNGLYDNIRELKEILSQMKECLEGFLMLTDMEKALLLKRDTERLQQVVERKQALSEKIAIIEEKRQVTIYSISQVVGIPITKLNSQTLATLLPEEERMDFELLIRTVRSLLYQIKEGNDQLKRLVGKISTIISQIFERVRQSIVHLECYSPKGTFRPLETPGLFVSQRA